MDRSVLARKPMTELKDIASHLSMRGYQKLRKAELIDAIISNGAEAGAQQTLTADLDGAAAPAATTHTAAEETAEATTDAEDGATTDAEDGATTDAEDGARKVLPPSRDAAPADDVRGAADAAEREPAAQPTDGEGPEGDRDGGRPRRSTRTRPQSGSRSETPETDEDPAARQGGAPDRDQPDDDEDAGSRKRRNRRDRRKRNRDRADEDGGGQESGGQDGQDDPRGSGQGGRGNAGNQGNAGSGNQGNAGSGNPGNQGSGNQGSGNQGNAGSQGGPSGGQAGSGNEPGEVRAGVLDILPEGYGFLRTTGYLPGERDVYVSQGQIRKHALRRGDVVQGPIRQQRSNEKVPALHHVQKVNGEELQHGQAPARPTFEDLAVATPAVRLDILGGNDSPSLALRLVDLVAPLGEGQRALVLCPPRSAKDALIRDLADAVADADPDVHLMLVMLDERPEAIAAMSDAVDGEVIASTFDASAEEHVQIAELAFERAQRMVELGHDVVVLLDSLTRLARAHGVTVQSNGRTIAPGLEAASLYPTKRIMSAARSIDGEGSLTIIATMLTHTGSALDDAILQEFRRTANAEIVLDQTLTRRGVWPAISVQDSGTLDDTTLQDEEEVATVRRLRRAVEALSPADATELVLDKMAQTDTNPDFLTQIMKSGL